MEKPHRKGHAVYSANYIQTTGQAFVTRQVVENVLPTIGMHREYIYQPSLSPMAIVSWFIAWYQLWRDVAFRHVGTLYIVCSRSNFGFVRDVPALLLARVGVRVVVHAHGSDIVDLLNGRKFSPLARVLYRKCELVLPSRHLLGPLKQVEFRQVYVCENFAHLPPMTSEIPLKSTASTLKVFWNSNVISSKGVFDVMETVSSLAENGTDIELQMIGNILGDQELSDAAAEERFHAMSRSKFLSYHGGVSAKRANELILESDVITLPSRYPSECQPLALAQAMCAGRAVIASDTPAMRATLRGYPAEFVPLRDNSALSKALLRLHEEKKTGAADFFASRVKEASIARERFSVERFDKQIRKILLNLRYCVSSLLFAGPTSAGWDFLL